MRRPHVFLLLALALFSLSSSLIRWLVLHGGELSGAATTAISFCNVLFVGNLCAGLLVVVWFRPRRLWRELAQTTRRVRGALAANTILSVAVPSLLFTALEQTNVTNLVLLSRFEAVAFALLSFVTFGTRASRRQWLAYAAISAGIGTVLWLQGRFTLLAGDGLVLLAAILLAVSSCVTRGMCGACSQPLLAFVRTGVSAVVFFWIAVGLFGFSHFGSAFSGELWGVMLLYAGLVVVIGQYAWFRAQSTLPERTLASGSLLMPVLGILFAHLLLGEVPTQAQWVGAGVILSGMLLGRGAAEAGRPEGPGMERTLAAA